MRRVAMWILIATCTFTLGAASAALWLEARRPAATRKEPPPAPPCAGALALDPGADVRAASGLPILDYCELVGNPERYSGKVVRVRARLGGFIHGMLFYDQVCGEADGQAAVSYHPATAEEIGRMLNRARGSDSPGNWMEPVDIIATGRFEKVTPSHRSDSIYDTAALQFEIIRVEKASKPR